MIHIARTPVPARLDLGDANSIASRERTKLAEHIRTMNKSPPNSMFKAYAHPTVRDALRDMFHNKCAYCESEIAGSQDTDIEHYRPKGRVTEATAAGVQHPGYWWLAMDWTNLVLSCAHCNQTRRQIIFRDGMTEEEVKTLIEAGEMETVGKHDSFPTEDSRWVISADHDLTTEKPLLIDPTRVNPVLHLEWVVNEGLSTVRPHNGSAVGQASISTFGLNRRRLTEGRLKKLRMLRLQGHLIVKHLNRAMSATTDDEAADFRNSALEQIELLRAACAEDQPFAAVARAYLAELIRTIEEMR